LGFSRVWELNEVAVRQGSSPVTPRVWTRGVRTSRLVPLVSPQRVLQLATALPVAWTAPFHSQLSLSLACAFFSASPPLLWRARARVSPCLRPSDSIHRSASFPATPSSSWLQLSSLGKPALPSPSRDTSPELRYGHRHRGQGSVVHHSSSSLSQKLR